MAARTADFICCPYLIWLWTVADMAARTALLPRGHQSLSAVDGRRYGGKNSLQTMISSCTLAVDGRRYGGKNSGSTEVIEQKLAVDGRRYGGKNSSPQFM